MNLTVSPAIMEVEKSGLEDYQPLEKATCKGLINYPVGPRITTSNFSH